jgi:HdeA/HdeB family protein
LVQLWRVSGKGLSVGAPSFVSIRARGVLCGRILSQRGSRSHQDGQAVPPGKEEIVKNANLMLFGLLAAVVPSANGIAQTTIDVAKITCEQLVLLKVADPDHLAIWLSGYYNGKRNTTTVEVEQLKETARKVRSYCLYNKGTVMEAVESLMATTK